MRSPEGGAVDGADAAATLHAFARIGRLARRHGELRTALARRLDPATHSRYAHDTALVESEIHTVRRDWRRLTGAEREHSYAEICRRYGLSRERIRQIELEIMDKLRRAPRNRHTAHATTKIA